jgi:hypothetical protein
VDDRAPALLRPVIQRQAGAPNGQSVRRLAARSYRLGYQAANQAGLVRDCITRGNNAPGQVLDSASRGAMMGPLMTLGYDNVGRDACAGCGESTAVGTVHFSDRRTLPDGTRLCAICNAMAAAHHGRQRLTDEEVRQLINNGSMAGITWANNHI